MNIPCGEKKRERKKIYERKKEKGCVSEKL
jgi:hypothetical protein